MCARVRLAPLPPNASAPACRVRSTAAPLSPARQGRRPVALGFVWLRCPEQRTLPRRVRSGAAPRSRERQDATRGRQDARLVRQVMVLEPGQRHDRVVAGHPLERAPAATRDPSPRCAPRSRRRSRRSAPPRARSRTAPVFSTDVRIVSKSSALSVATSITSADTASAASAAAAASVSLTMAPQVTSVMSMPSRRTNRCRAAAPRRRPRPPA